MPPLPGIHNPWIEIVDGNISVRKDGQYADQERPKDEVGENHKATARNQYCQGVIGENERGLALMVFRERSQRRSEILWKEEDKP
jgi:hypothetical protein